MKIVLEFDDGTRVASWSSHDRYTLEIFSALYNATQHPSLDRVLDEMESIQEPVDARATDDRAAVEVLEGKCREIEVAS